MLALLYTAYALIRCGFNPSLGPPLPPEEQVLLQQLLARLVFSEEG